MSNLFIKETHFGSPIWTADFPQYVDDINKISNEYINVIKKRNKKMYSERDKKLKAKIGERYGVYHSLTMLNDKRMQGFINFCALRSNDFMTWSGFDISKHEALITEFWVQEFNKLGGGHHAPHVHWNQHVSGFYFLKCSDKTSYPIFHDPRPGALMTKLPQLQPEKLSFANEAINYKVKPGTMIIFPGYLTHEYALDYGIEPFRFIHFNIQYLPKSEVSARINV